MIDQEKAEAYAILSMLKDNGFKFLYLESVAFISCLNPDFQPDNGLNPYLAYRLEILLDAIKNDPAS